MQQEKGNVEANMKYNYIEDFTFCSVNNLNCTNIQHLRLWNWLMAQKKHNSLLLLHH